MSKVFGYMRVSQSSQTVSNQKIELLASDLNITEWYSDEGVSGTKKQMERKGFSAMIEATRPGDTIVMAKLDRLGRNALDVLQTLEDIKIKEVRVIVLQLGSMDVTSPAGKLMMTMLAAVAEMEMDVLKERIHAGLIRAKDEGVVMGAPTKIAPDVLENICKDKKAGLTLDKISAKYSVNRSTAARAITRWQGDLQGYSKEFHSRVEHLKVKKEKLMSKSSRVA